MSQREKLLYTLTDVTGIETTVEINGIQLWKLNILEMCQNSLLLGFLCFCRTGNRNLLGFCVDFTLFCFQLSKAPNF